MSDFKTNVRDNALHGIATGVQIATETVAKTMGPKGLNIAMEMDEFPFYGCTNDGATLIDKMDFTDSLEKIGLNSLKESCSRSNSNSGDGSTTTCVLLNAILQEAIKSGSTGMELKKELDKVLPELIKLIDEQKKEITDVTAVATIAGESEEIGKILGEIYTKIGKDGIIHPEGSGTYETSYSFIEGVRFASTGYLSPYMVHDEQALKEGRKETKAVYEKPLILVTKRKIEKDADVEKLVEFTVQANRPLVIFTDDMDSNVASHLVAVHRAKAGKILIIKAPVVYKNSAFEDFAKCTGATIIEDAAGIDFKNTNKVLESLGTCDKIIVDKEETLLIGTQDMTSHIADLKTREGIEAKMSLSWLTTKTVLLKIGALSETDLYYKRLKYEDAINSSRLALQGGVVVGGGVCLLNVANGLVGDSTGVKILREALKAPFKQIIKNATNPFYPATNEKGELNIAGDIIGFDAKNGIMVNMYEAGIIDSAEIVKGAVKNALGIASTLITISSLITKPQKTVEQLTLETLQGRGMRPF